MTINIVPLADVPAQPWRNRGGVTHELLAWPTDRGSDWGLRVSVATIDSDGPFSPFPGVQRWFAVVEGEGVNLRSRGGRIRCVRGDPPFEFDGADAPHCTLRNGPTRDLNLMTRRERGRAVMRQVDPADPLLPMTDGLLWRGVFCAGPAALTVAGNVTRLPAMSLAWTDATAAPWHCHSASPAWWLTLDLENSR